MVSSNTYLLITTQIIKNQIYIFNNNIDIFINNNTNNRVLNKHLAHLMTQGETTSLTNPPLFDGIAYVFQITTLFSTLARKSCPYGWSLRISAFIKLYFIMAEAIRLKLHGPLFWPIGILHFLGNPTNIIGERDLDHLPFCGHVPTHFDLPRGALFHLGFMRPRDRKLVHLRSNLT